MTGIGIANRALAALVALALLAGALVVAGEIVLAALGRDPWVLPYHSWYSTARDNTWDSGATRLVLAGLVLAGLALLAAQLAPRRPHELSLPDQAGAPPATLTRRGLERSVEQSVSSVDGVSRVGARLRRGTVTVVADTNRRRQGDLEQRVQEAGEARLGALGLAGGITLDARVRTRQSR